MLGRVFIGELDVIGDGGEIGCSTLFQLRQRGADIVIREKLVAGHADFADHGFGHLQHNHAALEFLFRNVNSDGAIAFGAVGGFEDFKGALNVAIDAVFPGEAGNQAGDFVFRQQAVAAHVETGNFEFLVRSTYCQCTEKQARRQSGPKYFFHTSPSIRLACHSACWCTHTHAPPERASVS